MRRDPLGLRCGALPSRGRSLNSSFLLLFVALFSGLAAGLAAAAFTRRSGLERGILPISLLAGTGGAHTVLHFALVLTGWQQPFALTVAFNCLYLLVASLAFLSLFDFLLFDRIFARQGVVVPVFFRWILRWGLFAFFLALILRLTYGVDLVPVVAATSALSIVVGFALQTAISNLFAGMSIHLERVCRVGDWVTIGDVEGEVAEMSWRAVHVRTWENRMVIVPNNRFLSEAFVNHNLPSRVDGRILEIGTHYRHPPLEVIRALVETARDVPGVLHRPAPIALVKGYDDFAVTFRLRFFITDFSKRNEIDGEVMRRVWYRFRRDGIQIPFPIRTLVNETPHPDALRLAAEEETAARIEALRRCAIFEGQNDRTLRRIAEGLEAVSFTDGEAIVVEGGARSGLLPGARRNLPDLQALRRQGGGLRRDSSRRLLRGIRSPHRGTPPRDGALRRRRDSLPPRREDDARGAPREPRRGRDPFPRDLGADPPRVRGREGGRRLGGGHVRRPLLRKDPRAFRERGFRGGRLAFPSPPRPAILGP